MADRTRSRIAFRAATVRAIAPYRLPVARVQGRGRAVVGGRLSDGCGDGEEKVALIHRLLRRLVPAIPYSHAHHFSPGARAKSATRPTTRGLFADARGESVALVVAGLLIGRTIPFIDSTPNWVRDLSPRCLVFKCLTCSLRIVESSRAIREASQVAWLQVHAGSGRREIEARIFDSFGRNNHVEQARSPHGLNPHAPRTGSPRQRCAHHRNNS